MVWFVERVSYESQEILVELCPFIYPPHIQTEMRETEQFPGILLGATIPCFMYFNTSTFEAILFEQLLGKDTAQGMKRAMKIRKQSAHTSLKSIPRVFSKLSHQWSRSKAKLSHGYQ